MLTITALKDFSRGTGTPQWYAALWDSEACYEDGPIDSTRHCNTQEQALSLGKQTWPMAQVLESNSKRP